MRSGSEFKRLQLKPHRDRRLRAGHLWVFSNEVDDEVTPVRQLEPGEAVEVSDAYGRFIGTGYANPHSLICARIVSRDPRQSLSTSLLIHRLKVALGLRQRLFVRPFYRLAYGESDVLPGLIVDRYAELLVVQITTAGMECRIDGVLEALRKVLRPRGILLRNDSSVRALEGLPLYVKTADGVIPETVEIDEHEARFRLSLTQGQKTGWFFDQSDNRFQVARYVKGMRVLDLFSYVGAWGVRAALSGAVSVLCVDDAHQALDRVRENATINGLEDRVATVHGDTFEVLAQLRDAHERFDVVILDPPAFIKRRQNQKRGVHAYRRLNELAMRVLAKDGFLVSCSCSYHLPTQVLVEQIYRAARHVDRRVQVLAYGTQSVDHPVHPAMPETAYLKAVFARVYL